VNEPAAQSVVGEIHNVSCKNGSDGSINITNTGGVSPYSYLWSNGETTRDISGLTIGTYFITITDYNSCVLTDNWTLTEPDMLTIEASATSVTCYSYSDGAIDLTVGGGTSPYSYLWSNGTITQDLTGIPAGTYSVTVTDSHSCTAIDDWTVVEPPAWSAEIEGPVFVCQNSTDNVYCATVVDSTHPGADYSYEWVVTGGFIMLGQNTPCITVTWPPCQDGVVALIVTRLLDGCTFTKSIVVTVNPVPTPIITGAVQVESGTDSMQYCTPHVDGHLYSWSVIGGSVISGQGTNCIIIDWGPYPACGCGSVSVAETFNGCTGTYTLPISIIPGSNISIAGYVTYNNSQFTLMNGVTVQLRNSSGNVVGTTVSANHSVSGVAGYYAFTDIPAGNYHISGSYNGSWGGNNATDALIIQLNSGGVYPLAGLRRTVANVNGSVNPFISALDALYVKLRTVGMISSYPAGEWKVTDTTFALAGTAIAMNLNAMCVGDVNGSFVPFGFKESPLISVIEDEAVVVPVNEPFKYHVRSNAEADLGAMTLFLGYDQSVFEILDVTGTLDEMKHTLQNGTLSLAWSDTRPMHVKSNDPIITFEIRAKEPVTEASGIFTLKQGSEFADIGAKPFDNFDIRMAKVVSVESNNELSLFNYPNPFSNKTTIVYTLPEAGHVKLALTNLYGEVIKVLTDDNMASGIHSVVVDPAELNLASGVYLYEIIFNGITDSKHKVNKMVFTR
jgi:hypothetical protein